MDPKFGNTLINERLLGGTFCGNITQSSTDNFSFNALDSCKGDSGGPLVYLDDNIGRYVQLGVVSGGNCFSKNKPSIYVRLEDASILKFIYETAFSLNLPAEGKSTFRILHDIYIFFYNSDS